METELERKVKWLRGLKNKAWEPEDYADIDDICEAALTRSPQWQETSTAPRDGTRVLFCDIVNRGDPFVVFCADGDNDWRCDYDGSWIEWEPYEWCPIPALPAPPEVES